MRTAERSRRKADSKTNTFFSSKVIFRPKEKERVGRKTLVAELEDSMKQTEQTVKAEKETFLFLNIRK